MTEQPYRSKFATQGIYLLAFLAVVITLLGWVGFGMFFLSDNKVDAIRLILVGCWGELFVGVSYLFVLLDKHLLQITTSRKVVLGLLIAAFIALDWTGWWWVRGHGGDASLLPEVRNSAAYQEDQQQERLGEEMARMMEEADRMNRTLEGMRIWDSLDFPMPFQADSAALRENTQLWK